MQLLKDIVREQTEARKSKSIDNPYFGRSSSDLSVDSQEANESEVANHAEEDAGDSALDQASQSQLKEIVHSLDILVGRDDLVELRALEVDADGPPGLSTISGVFRDHRELAQKALELSEYAKGVYITLNPIRNNGIKSVRKK
jgi:hypothetical protein